MIFRLATWELVLLLVVVVIGTTVAGLVLGRRISHRSEHLREPFGVLQAALLGLVGLVLAFGLSRAVAPLRGAPRPAGAARGGARHAPPHRHVRPRPAHPRGDPGSRDARSSACAGRWSCRRRQTLRPVRQRVIVTTMSASTYGESVTWQPERPKFRPLRLVVSWLLTALSLWVAAVVLPGVAVDNALGRARDGRRDRRPERACCRRSSPRSACRSCSRSASSSCWSSTRSCCSLAGELLDGRYRGRQLRLGAARRARRRRGQRRARGHLRDERRRRRTRCA